MEPKLSLRKYLLQKFNKENSNVINITLQEILDNCKCTNKGITTLHHHVVNLNQTARKSNYLERFEVKTKDGYKRRYLEVTKVIKNEFKN